MLLRFFTPDLSREGRSQSRMVLDSKKRKKKKRMKKGKKDSFWASLEFCCYCEEISKVCVTESALKSLLRCRGDEQAACEHAHANEEGCLVVTSRRVIVARKGSSQAVPLVSGSPAQAGSVAGGFFAVPVTLLARAPRPRLRRRR